MLVCELILYIMESDCGGALNVVCFDGCGEGILVFSSEFDGLFA
jgi:hypothetical protein